MDRGCPLTPLWTVGALSLHPRSSSCKHDEYPNPWPPLRSVPFPLLTLGHSTRSAPWAPVECSSPPHTPGHSLRSIPWPPLRRVHPSLSLLVTPPDPHPGPLSVECSFPPLIPGHFPRSTPWRLLWSVCSCSGRAPPMIASAPSRPAWRCCRAGCRRWRRRRHAASP